MEVRVLEAADAAAYRELRLAGLVESPFSFSESAEDEAHRSLDEFARAIAAIGDPVRSFTLGACASGRLVGILSFRRDERRKALHKGMITAMYVAPPWRGRGLGRTLVERAVALARASPGLQQIYLWALVSPGRTSAVGFYERLGFRAQGPKAENDLIIEGESVAACYMTLSFAGSLG